MNRGYVLCNGNSASSQMAEGWLRHLAGDRFEIGSANTQPVGLHAGSVDAMAKGGGNRYLTPPFKTRFRV
jgi:arsenate reductase